MKNAYSASERLKRRKLPKRKKIGLGKILLAAVALGTGIFGCGKSSPVSYTPPEEPKTRKEQVADLLAYAPSSQKRQAAESHTQNWNLSPRLRKSGVSTSPENTLWVKTRKEWEEGPDFNRDRKVNWSDFLLFKEAFLDFYYERGNNPRFDLDKDNDVDFSDFIAFAPNYGRYINSKLVVPSSPPPSPLTLPQVATVAKYLTNPEKIDLAQDPVFNEAIYEITKKKGLIAEFVYDENNNPIAVKFRNKNIFNYENDGYGELEVKAQKNGDTYTHNSQVKIPRDDRGILLSRQIRDEICPVPFAEHYTHPRKRAKGDPYDPKKWTGPLLTQAEIDMTHKATQALHYATSGYFPKNPKFLEGNHPDKLSENNILTWYWDDNEDRANTGTYPVGSKTIDTASITMTSSSSFAEALHEATHALGFNHPDINEFKGSETLLQRSGWDPNTKEFSSIGIFAMTAAYDEHRKE